MFNAVQVQEWLESVFAGERVPEYEITQSTVEQLWRLARETQAREAELEVVMEAMEQQTEEYLAESEAERCGFHLVNYCKHCSEVILL